MERLDDPTHRAAVVERLAELYAGKPVILGPGVLAGYTPVVRRLLDLDCRVLVLSTVRGAGEIPGPDECVVVDLDVPPAPSVTDELRMLDRLAHDLPDDALAAIDAFDPRLEAIWDPGPFVTNDAPILDRQVVGGRPGRFLEMEDKLFAETVWAAAGVPVAAHAIVDSDDLDGLVAASERLATELGSVWSGDARDGFNGGGDFVRWVVDADDRAEAYVFFLPRCDRVRVMPFLDGVPCSIHGIVLPDGTAVFRPVEIAMLRLPSERRFVYGGLSTYWDPPAADREEMREIARRVGDHLQATHGYRGAFGIDGVLTVDGFRPTELNTRMSAGVTLISDVDRDLFSLIQAHLVGGLDTGLSVEDLESLVPVMDEHRHGRPVALGHGATLPGEDEYDVALAAGRLERSDEATGTVLVLGNTPSGFFSKLDPCPLIEVGDRLAPLNAALMHFLDREYDAGFGPVTTAPDLR